MKAVTNFLKVAGMALALVFVTASAFAEQLCLPREAAVSQLGDRYGERAVGRGLGTSRPGNGRDVPQ